jgi:hypothetical protein
MIETLGAISENRSNTPKVFEHPKYIIVTVSYLDRTHDTIC